MRRYPSLFCLIFVVAGIVIADWSGGASYLFLALAVATFVISIWFRNAPTRSLLIAGLGLTLALLSAFHFSHRFMQSGPRDVRRIITEPTMCRIWGRVTDWPEIKPTVTEIKLAVDSIATDKARPVQGTILLKVTDSTTQLQRADRIEFAGRIYPLPESQGQSFDYNRFLRLKGVGAIVYLPTLLNVRVDRRSSHSFFSFVDRLREAVVESLDRNLSPTPAALAKGFLIGETREIPPDVYRMFRDSGTLHLLAVSGSNVALVLLFFVILMRPFGLKPALRSGFLLLVILLFAALSYGEPSVIRASVMATLVLASRALHRRIDLNNIIALAALIILLIDPSQFFDVGFQLSFVTAWGLIFIVPRVARTVQPRSGLRWWKYFYMPFTVAIVAQLCSAPLIMYYFERLPYISVAANLVVVPLVSIAVVGVLAIPVANLILPLAGLFVGSLVNMFLSFVLEVLHFFGSDALVLEVGWNPPGWVSITLVLAAYMVLAGATIAIQSRKFRRITLIGILIGSNLFLLGSAFVGSDTNQRSLTFHPVPGGVMALLRQDSGESADMVICELRQRRYDIDERILEPLLRENGLTSLDRLFLLSADIDACDDILRLAARYGADVHIPRMMSASVETARLSVEEYPADRIHVWSDAVYRPGQIGFQAAQAGLILESEERSIVFTARLRPVHFREIPSTGNPVLVIGDRWNPTPDDWMRLSRLGYERIICSKVEQYHPNEDSHPEDGTEILPTDFVTSLYHQGIVTLIVDQP